MKPFVFRIPPKVVFGAGIINQIGEETAELGGTALLVTGRSSARKTGMLDVVTASLESAKLRCILFEEVEPDPSVETVQKGVDLAKEHGVDVIIALGGGSPMDAAKAIALMCTNPGHISDYESTAPKKPGLPIVAVPTTAGTASEITRATVITDTSRKVKMLILTPHVIPRTAVLDPELTKSLPASIAAATGMDALTHAIEAYVSKVSNPVSDLNALAAVELIGASLLRAVLHGDDMEARSNMMLGQMLAGFAFSNASVGLVHSMSRPLGAHYGVAHGSANALLLGPVMAYNLPACMEEYARLAEALGENTTGLTLREAAETAVASVDRLFNDTGLPASLAEYGIGADDVGKLADDAFASGSTNFNPRRPTRDEIAELYTSLI
jgi:1,3-propanediol dehydrogenase/alcohol dehydrogenase